MDKNQIIEYVLNSPENTNPAILGQMLDALSTNEQVVAEPTILYLSGLGITSIMKMIVLLRQTEKFGLLLQLVKKYAWIQKKNPLH